MGYFLCVCVCVRTLVFVCMSVCVRERPKQLNKKAAWEEHKNPVTFMNRKAKKCRDLYAEQKAEAGEKNKIK